MIVLSKSSMILALAALCGFALFLYRDQIALWLSGSRKRGASQRRPQGRTVSAARGGKKPLQLKNSPAPQLSALPTKTDQGAHRHQVASLHVAIWTYDHVLERMSPEMAVSALNEFHELGESVVREMGGCFDRSSGSSFFAFWPTQGTEHREVSSAVKCALMLRREFSSWNGMRKTEGLAPLTVVMGADWGDALVGVIGRNPGRENSIVGQIVSRSRVLSQLAVAQGTDFLVSDDLWQRVSNKYLGESVIEAQLSGYGGVTSCFRVSGYREHCGNEVEIVEPSISLDARQSGSRLTEVASLNQAPELRRWMVNNGSQILGPLTSQEVAQRLYSMDVDFDCECWEDGKGKRLPISRSGIFGTEETEGAKYWVFDGKTLHGPLTSGFLRTWIFRGVFPKDAKFCDTSTVKGWKSIGAWSEGAQNTGENESPRSPDSDESVPSHEASYDELSVVASVLTSQLGSRAQELSISSPGGIGAADEPSVLMEVNTLEPEPKVEVDVSSSEKSEISPAPLMEPVSVAAPVVAQDMPPPFMPILESKLEAEVTPLPVSEAHRLEAAPVAIEPVKEKSPAVSETQAPPGKKGYPPIRFSITAKTMVKQPDSEAKPVETPASVTSSTPSLIPELVVLEKADKDAA